jgi:predicted enzyme related to lactoylglutathione lyase
MTDLSFINLYVADTAASVTFYTALLGGKPVQASPGYAMFATKSGVTLGLWARDNVQPVVSSTRGETCEICFTVADTDATHDDWVARGIAIAQPPTTMGFGRTFTALDPDGHRLRVFTPTPT